MKKILLGTTTLVGAALVAQAALADAPKLTVGGFSEAQLGVMSDDLDTTQRGHSFRNDNEISFKVDGKSDTGLGYGAEIWLEADVTADADNQGGNASKTFLYFEGGWGRVELGSTLGPDQTLKIGAESIARATGGIDGDWTYFANSGAQFIATPDLPLAYGFDGAPTNLGDESNENASKIVYYTPKWSGFQAGLAFIPGQDTRGQQTHQKAGLADTTAGESEDIFAVGVNWSGQWDAISIGLAGTGEWGSGESAATEDLSAWQVGAKLGYMGFSLAASYGDWSDSNRTAANLDDSDFWTVGASYENGPWGVSVTYLDSDYSVSSTTENEFTSWSIGADYKLAPGLTPYVEATWYDQDVPGVSVNDNEGHVFLVGSQLNF